MQYKFISSIQLDEWEIETDTGFRPVSHLHITKPFVIWTIETESGRTLECADDHILYIDDTTQEIFAKDLCVGDIIVVATGTDRIASIRETTRSENMFDFTVESDDHRYYTNGILSHNTSVATVIILHFALFNDSKKIALLANKADMSQEILSRIQLAYEYLPAWLKCGVSEWNKRRIEFDNGSIIMAAASSSSSVRGQSVAMLYIDECAFVEHWEEFSASVLPTLSSGEQTRIIFTSTPCGLNHFYYYCEGAKTDTNGFSYLEVPWHKVPGRDDKWKNDIMGMINNDPEKFEVEFNCSFIGSSGTLISGATLKTLFHRLPVMSNYGYGFHIYDNPVKDRRYFITVDVSRGKGLDYSAFHVIDTTDVPFKQAAVFKNNMITPTDYAEFIFRTAKLYNDAFILVEINDIGGQVADLLYDDFEYENILSTENHGRAGKRISGGFGKNVDRGIRTTTTVKAVGCSMIKLLIEQKKLILNDKDTIAELNVFSKKGKSYEAEPGHHDDLVMGLVLFAWLSQDKFFSEMNNDSILRHLRDRTESEMMDEMVGFGFVYDSIDDFDDNAPVRMDGGWWNHVNV